MFAEYFSCEILEIFFLDRNNNEFEYETVNNIISPLIRKLAGKFVKTNLRTSVVDFFYHALAFLLASLFDDSLVNL